MKRMSLLALALVVVLATMGVGYTLWSEQLSITGTVQTGSVDVKFSGPNTLTCVDTPTGTLCGDAIPLDKRTATCTATREVGPGEPEPGTGGALDADILKITVTGAYPSFHCYVAFDVANVGTVPVNVTRPVFHDGAGNAGWVHIVDNFCYANNEQVDPGGVTTHLDGSLAGTIFDNTQFRGESCIIDTHFSNTTTNDGQLIPQGASFNILGTINGNQWNEPQP